MESTHSKFLQLILIKPNGKLKVSQQIEFPSKMPQLLCHVRDTHSWLILSYKDKSGSEVKKEMNLKSFSWVKRDG